MRPRFGSYRSWRHLLVGAAWAALALPSAKAQSPAAAPNSTGAGVPLNVAPAPPGYPLPYPLPFSTAPCLPPGVLPYPTVPTAPTAPTVPTPGVTPPAGETAPGMPGATTDTGAGAGTSSGFNVAGAGEAGGSALSGGNFSGGGNGGYVDSAIPVTQYRLRVDAADGDNRPDRADFFYPKCGCFPGAPGPGRPATATSPGTGRAINVNFQELTNYFELAVNPRLSGFVEIPVRWVNLSYAEPTAQPQTNSGLSDVQFGFKAALVYNLDQVLTFQFRTYSPTGDAARGLGRNNWNLEPAFLYYQRLSPRMFFEGEIRDFIPIASADDFAGNVLRYGGALSYLAYSQPNFRVAPVGELVGWSVLSGKELTEAGAVSAAGDFIANAKFGVRFGFGQLVQPGFLNRADLYVGYGRALTGAVWYKDIFRTEFRLRF